jgi:MFS family permease
MSKLDFFRRTSLEGQGRRASRKNELPRNVYNNFAFEFFNAMFWQSLGAPMVLFIRQSGGSAFAVGLISALPLLLMPITLASSRFVEQYGYRRTAITFWTVRWMISSPIIILALVQTEWLETWRSWLALGVLVLYHLCRNFGISGWMPWLTSIIPKERRGLYLSRATLFSNLGSILTFLAVGMILGTNPSLSTFAVVFGLGLLGGLISSIFMSRIRDLEDPTHRREGARQSLWEGFRNSLQLPGFKTFIIIQTFYGVAFFGIPALSLIYLREKVGINPGLIIYFSTGGVIGAAISSIAWGRWIDRRQSVLSLQLLSFLGLCFNSVLWLILAVMPAGLNYVLAATLQVLTSVWITALAMSQSHSIMTLAPEEDRVMFQNIATLVTYLSQALAPTLWGLLLDYLDHNKVALDFGFYRLEAYQIFFAATLLIGLLGVYFLFRFLSQNRKIPQVSQGRK